MLDLLFQGCSVVDGSGGAPYDADVGVADGRVAIIGAALEQPAARLVDASGLCLAPGFIDAHTHSDITLLVDPRAESKVRQGITTEVVGNCGDSPAPLRAAAAEELRAQAADYSLEVDWAGMSGYLSRLRTTGTAVNVVPLVGHNTVRGCVLGFADTQPTTSQQAEMERLVSETMDEGARGLSTGLFYPPGVYAGIDEVVGLAAAAAACGGLYTSHIRSEGAEVLEAVAEALAVGERSGAFVEISHVKLSGYRAWPLLDALVEQLDTAAARGVRVGCDQYPYAASSTWLGAMLPYWAQQGGAAAVAARLIARDVRARVRLEYEHERDAWDDRGGVRDWAGIVVSACTARPETIGCSLAEIAGRADPLDAAMDLILASEGQAECVWHDQDEANVTALLAHPLVVVGSDGDAVAPWGVLGAQRPHPRTYGMFPRVLGRYVRALGVLSLPAAVRKMTALTAARFGLRDRGHLRVGAYADLVAFDPSTVADRATYADPQRFPAGIPYVAVNGRLVVDGGEHSGELPGRVL